jgi:DNA invertase Pin-like site-specific DNA recombinase
MRRRQDMRAIIYCRTSSDDESGDDKSIPQQAADCIRLCKEQGYTVLGTVKEPNRSGRLYPEGAAVASMDKAIIAYTKTMPHKTRAGLAKVMALMPQADVIVIRDNERLARPLSDSFLAQFLTQEFTAAKIKIHSIMDGLKDPSDWETQFLGAIRSMPLDRETRKRAALSKARVQEIRDSGKWRTCRFFGYRNVGKNVEIIREQADVVIQIFQWILGGVNLAQIVRRLETAAPDRSWTRNVLAILVDKPEYAGKCRDSRGRMIDSKAYPALVSFRDWQAVQKWRSKNKARVGRPTKVIGGHPLSGLVLCGYCGTRMQIHIGATWDKGPMYRYRCPSVEKSKSHCTSALVAERRLLGFARAFAPLAKQALPKPESDEKREERRKELESQRARLLKKEDSLVDAADISADTVRRQLARIDEEIKSVDGLLLTLQEAPKISFHRDVSPALNSLLTSSILNGESLRQVLQAAITSIAVYGEKIIVTLHNGATIDTPRVRYTSQRIPPIACMEPVSKAMFPYRVLLPLQSCLSGKGKIPKGIIAPLGIDELKNLDGERRRIYKDEFIEVMTVGESKGTKTERS